MLDHEVEIWEMFPNKVADATVFWDCLKGSVIVLVCGHRTTDGYIVYVGDSELGNLCLKYVHIIIVEYW